MAIKVCDAIMGSGKSSAAINYMNSHPEKKFIYITPYLDEADRIKRSCPDLNFKEPNGNLPEFGFRKYNHTVELMTNGENITSTHNMFLRYSDEMIELIKDRRYILIIDEAVDMMRQSSISASDLKLLERVGWTTSDDGGVGIKPDEEYDGGMLDEIITISRGNRIIDMPCMKKGASLLYWIYSKEILEAFTEVIVLTYLFSSQVMKYYFDIVNINFEYIGIERGPGGEYLFSDQTLYLPEYTATLSRKIHIFDNNKLNSIGNYTHALSQAWFERSGEDYDRKKEILKNNVYNFFTHYHGDKPASKRLWATYKIGEKAIRGNGFTRRNIAFNTKATNDYKDKQVLAYCVNIFMRPNEKTYYTQHGVDYKEDEYALSVMVQWIWRSAIRDGKEIWIYIPSKRMRMLLKDWIASVEKKYRDNMRPGGDRNGR